MPAVILDLIINYLSGNNTKRDQPVYNPSRYCRRSIPIVLLYALNMTIYFSIFCDWGY